MPTPPKRPPARICAFLLAPLLLLVVAGAGAPAHAQTAALWFAPHGKTPPQSAALTVLDAASSRAGRFKVDVMYGDDVPAAHSIKFQLHMDSGKLELAGVENVATAYFSSAATDPSMKQTAYADYQSALGAPAPDDRDETTDSLIYPAWAALSGGLFNSATLSAPQRLLTLNLKWKPGAAGRANLNFTADAGDVAVIDSYSLTSLTVQGPSD